ncbi:MAG: hypothetical protein ACT4NX_09485 [Deltaproteobacteria bacterium]
MLETYFIRDATSYADAELNAMQGAFAKNFILFENPELGTHQNPLAPEIKIHIKLLMGLLPEQLFNHLGEDLALSIDDSFIAAFNKPRATAGGMPSLVFEFVGHIVCFRLRIASPDGTTLKAGAKAMMEKILDTLDAQELSSSPQETKKFSFEYENGEWR